MRTVTFDSAQVAASPQHDCGVFTRTMPDDEVPAFVAALESLGFTPTVTG